MCASKSAQNIDCNLFWKDKTFKILSISSQIFSRESEAIFFRLYALTANFF